MTSQRNKTNLLRLSIFSAGLFALLLCFGPTIAWVSSVYAQPAPTSAPVTKPATTSATTPATKATTTAALPKAEPSKTEPSKTEPSKAKPIVAPTTVVTSPEKAQSWWQAMLVPVLSVVGLFIAAFLAAGLRKLVQLIEKKWNIDIPESVETLMIEKARWALAWAEEQAEKRLLYGDGKKTDGAVKLTSVVDLLEKFAQSLGYGETWQRDKIEKLAEGVLHLERSPGVGSEGDRADALVAKANGNK